MKRFRILIVVGIIAALVVPFSVFAATSDSTVAKSVRGFFGIDYSKLTDQQKADVKTYSQKMADLQKEFINKMVSNGTLTKEQGDAEIKKIDEALKASQDNGTAYGLGPGKGFFNGDEKRGFHGMEALDTSKLTDQQKAGLKDTAEKMLALQKEYIDKAVSFGLLTKDQGDNIKQKLDTAFASDKTGDPSVYMMGLKGFPGFGFGFKTDSSKLTDQQKTELADFPKKMAELQKEMINKLVDYGAMAKEQGDAAIKRINAMSEFKPGNGDLKGMMKGRFNEGQHPAAPDTAAGSGESL